MRPRPQRLLGLAGIAVAGLSALVGCEARVLDVRVSIVTAACVAPPPLEGVTHLRVRVTGEGLERPLEALSLLSDPDREVRIPEIPAGKARVVEVRAFAGDPGGGGALVSMGRSVPFDVPEALPGRRELSLSVFLRRVNAFTPPSSVLSPTSCSRMGTPRAGHTATVLENGKVLILGGYSAASSTTRTASAKAELYNPNTGIFETAPDVGVANNQQQITPLPRAFHTATLMTNGQVLIWGGENYAPGAIPLASMLVYDPGQNAYGPIPSQNLPERNGRSHHVAVLEQSGRVLILGGVTGSPPVLDDRVEWYDPETTRSQLVPAESFSRREMSALAVQGGRYVAVAGGSNGQGLSAEVVFFTFDGTAFGRVRTQQTLQLREPRRQAAAALLPGGNDLLLIGGFTDPELMQASDTSELVVTRDAFEVVPGPAIKKARGELCAAMFPDGRILTVGGRTAEIGGPRSDGTVELLIPGTSTSVLEKDPLTVPRHHHTCTPLGDGTVLVLGGVNESGSNTEILSDAWIFTPEPLD